MEDFLTALESVKKYLKCSLCNELVQDPSNFSDCSHTFCSKHIVIEKSNSCFTCHKGRLRINPNAHIQNEMIENFKQLESLFNGKENKNPDRISPIIEETGHHLGRNNNTHEEGESPSEDKGKKRPSLQLKARSKPTPPLNSKKTISGTDRGVKEENSAKFLENQAKESSVIDCILPSPLQDGCLLPVCTSKSLRGKTNLTIPSSALTTPGSTATVQTLKKRAQSAVASKRKSSEAKKSKSNLTSDTSKPGSSSKILQLKLTPLEHAVTPDLKLKEKAKPPNVHISPSSENIFTEVYLKKRNNKGETALHAACVRGNLDLVSRLLAAGADPNTRDHAGWTPLHEAVGGGREELARALLAHGALAAPPGPRYVTPLHEAARCRLPHLAALLLQHGASPHARDEDGRTPLQLAAQDEDMLRLLTQAVPSSNQLHNCIASTRTCQTDVRTFFPSQLSKESLTKLRKLCKFHENLKIDTEFSTSVTHVMVEECRVNLDTLMAVAGAKSIVTAGWLDRCDMKILADTKDFELNSLGGEVTCVALSVANRLHLKPGLFHGCHFFFLGFTSEHQISAHLKVKKLDLSRLVQAAGGAVLKREPDPEGIWERRVPYHAPPTGPLQACSHYIVYQSRPQLAYNMKHLRSLPVTWLVECLLSFRIVDPPL